MVYILLAHTVIWKRVYLIKKLLIVVKPINLIKAVNEQLKNGTINQYRRIIKQFQICINYEQHNLNLQA